MFGVFFFRRTQTLTLALQPHAIKKHCAHPQRLCQHWAYLPEPLFSLIIMFLFARRYFHEFSFVSFIFTQLEVCYEFLVLHQDILVYILRVSLRSYHFPLICNGHLIIDFSGATVFPQVLSHWLWFSSTQYYRDVYSIAGFGGGRAREHRTS